MASDRCRICDNLSYASVCYQCSSHPLYKSHVLAEAKIETVERQLQATTDNERTALNKIGTLEEKLASARADGARDVAAFLLEHGLERAANMAEVVAGRIARGETK